MASGQQGGPWEPETCVSEGMNVVLQMFSDKEEQKQSFIYPTSPFLIFKILNIHVAC